MSLDVPDPELNANGFLPSSAVSSNTVIALFQNSQADVSNLHQKLPTDLTSYLAWLF